MVVLAPVPVPEVPPPAGGQGARHVDHPCERGVNQVIPPAFYPEAQISVFAPTSTAIAVPDPADLFDGRAPERHVGALEVVDFHWSARVRSKVTGEGSVWAYQ